MLQVDSGGEDWEISIVKLPDTGRLVGNVASEKWSLETISENACYGPPDQI
jgi:hypothetical protein